MTAPKERPILFSGPMVRALLDGRKTQTRRIVKPQPPTSAAGVGAGHITSSDPEANGLWWWLDSADIMDASPIGDDFRCPYGVPGDRLWVKETWSDVNLYGGPGIAYRANGDVRDLMDDQSFLDRRGAFNYDDPRLAFGRAGLRFSVWSSDMVAGIEGTWRSSIHMPRWASRLTLLITDVRVERLQDITEADAIAEGWPGMDGTIAGDYPIGWYARLWNQINGPDSWDANPWVWAVSFEVIAP